MDYTCDKCGCNISFDVNNKDEKPGIQWHIKCDCGGVYKRQLTLEDMNNNPDDYDANEPLRRTYAARCKECEEYYPITCNRMIGGEFSLKCSCGGETYSVVFDTAWASGGFIESCRNARVNANRDKRRRFLETCHPKEIKQVNDKFPRQV